MAVREAMLHTAMLLCVSVKEMIYFLLYYPIRTESLLGMNSLKITADARGLRFKLGRVRATRGGQFPKKVALIKKEYALWLGADPPIL